VASRDKLLVIDPSTHHGTGNAGEVGAPYGSADEDPTALSAAPPKGEDQAWLDRFLKDVPNGIERKPRVRYFDLGDRTWRSAPTWRSAGTALKTMYLSAARSGSTKASPNDGTLAGGVPTGRDSYQDSYVYDPTAGRSVPMGKEGPDGFLPYAPLDQGLDEPSGLVFTGAPLSAPLRLAGPSELRFWAVTEASDMAWVARLVDVAPDGSGRLITQGWLRSSFRYVDPDRSRPGSPYLPDDRSTPVTVGETTEYRLDLWDTAYTLAPGHRLRLWLGSSDTPTHEPLPVAGRNLIFHDARYPSQLLLGVGGDAAAPSTCRIRSFRVSVPRGLKRVKVYVRGGRARMGRSAVVVKPAKGASKVSVKLVGVRDGKRVVVQRRRACR
jgi:putative CocE/NonD family hydrolase